VWTGKLMIVWGGTTGSDTLDSGAAYDPVTDTWTPTSTLGAPSARERHSAIWTGTRMIIWGGGERSLLDTGGVYDPLNDAWTPTPLVGAPSGREDHTAVWTGSRMVVWGGSISTGSISFTGADTGALYDPATDTWEPTSTVGAPSARSLHTAVWTGSRMLVWGGLADNSGGAYDPATDTWTPTATEGAPTVRADHTAVWAGRRMVIWGGVQMGLPFPGWVNTGGIYDPETDTWAPTSIDGAPSPRTEHTAVWTGRRMVVWGGATSVGSEPPFVTDTGGVYDPATDKWGPTTTVGAAEPRALHSAVWTGHGMLVWGGYDQVVNSLDSGGAYRPGAR
jgi:N-acetylneuraminic acid mutarotase